MKSVTYNKCIYNRDMSICWGFMKRCSGRVFSTEDNDVTFGVDLRLFEYKITFLYSICVKCWSG